MALAQDAGNLQPGRQPAGLVDGAVEQLLAVEQGMAAVLFPCPAAQRIDVDEVQRGAEDFGQPDGLGHRGWAAGRGVDSHHDGVSPAARAPDDHHRAGCRAGQIDADRAGHLAQDGAEAPAADYQQPCVPGGVAQHGCREPGLHDAVDGGARAFRLIAR